MKKLSKIDKDFIIDNYAVMKTADIANKVGLTNAGISIFAKRNNLKKKVRYYHTGKNWTDEEVQFLIKNWKMFSVSDLMAQLNKTKWAITSKKYELVKAGLFISVPKIQIVSSEDRLFYEERKKMWNDIYNPDYMTKNDLLKIEEEDEYTS